LFVYRIIRSAYNLYILFAIFGISLFILFKDIPKYKADKCMKEAKILKIIGLIYLIANPIIYIILHIGG